MEKLVEELRAVMPFKKTTDTGDIVLVVAENPQMMLYALVTSIERDASKRDEWWNIGLTFLSVPLQKAVWTLRTAQMTGREIFTMGGEKRFLTAVDLAYGQSALHASRIEAPPKPGKGGLKRIK